MTGRDGIGDDRRAESSEQGRDDQRRDRRVLVHRLDQIVGGGFEGRSDVHIDVDPLALDAQDRIAHRLAHRPDGPRGLRKENLRSIALLARQRGAEVDDGLAVGPKVGCQVRGTENTVSTGTLDLDAA